MRASAAAGRLRRAQLSDRMTALGDPIHAPFAHTIEQFGQACLRLEGADLLWFHSTSLINQMAKRQPARHRHEG